MSPLTTTDYTSENWDGYFTGLSSQTTDFTKVSANWVEPTITCSKTQSYAGFWVGLDGAFDAEVEQGGTEANCLSGSPTYDVWWEMYPNNDVQTVFAIKAGDSIQASVVYAAGTGIFTITVKDVTSGKSLVKTTSCLSGQNGCPRTSAEVISEDVGGGPAPDGLFYLPNYKTLTYTGVSVTNTAGHAGSLSDSAWQLGDVTEVSSAGITKQTTSALKASGTSFTTTWKHL